MKSNKIVFFDGVCNLCTSSVQIILRNDKNNHFKFASLQSKSAKEIIQDVELRSTDSIILFSNDKFYIKSTAILKIAYHLRFPLKLFYIFIIIPAFIRDGIYDYIAAKRYSWFGKKDKCWVASESLKEKFLE